MKILSEVFCFQGITIADVDENAAKKALTEVEAKFGSKKVVFIKTDVTVWQEFEGNRVSYNE